MALYNHLVNWILKVRRNYLYIKENHKYAFLQLFIKKFKRIKTSLRNLMYWFPIIWKDRDWDFYYIYMILRAKLIKTRQYMVLHSVTVTDERIKPITKCIDIINKLLEDDVIKEKFEEFFTKYGDIKLSFEKTDSGLYRVNIGYDKLTSDKEIKEADEEFKTLIKAEEEEKVRLINKLFSIMADNIQRWWD